MSPVRDAGGPYRPVEVFAESSTAFADDICPRTDQAFVPIKSNQFRQSTRLLSFGTLFLPRPPTQQKSRTSMTLCSRKGRVGLGPSHSRVWCSVAARHKFGRLVTVLTYELRPLGSPLGSPV